MIFIHIIFWPLYRCTPIHRWMGCGPHFIWDPHPIQRWIRMHQHGDREIIRTNIITLILSQDQNKPIPMSFVLKFMISQPKT